MLNVDLNKRIDTIKEETHRSYLTSEELQALIKTPCAVPVMKQAAIFSSLTGLRFGDVQKLTWGEINYSEAEGNYIRFIQEKTAGAEVLPIPEQAVLFAGERRSDSAKVFPSLEYSDYNNRLLQKWVNEAGINKEITFHCFRHTNATLLLNLGVDLFTVSKMLGHKEIKTTQIYAKIVDKTKRTAAERINSIDLSI